MITSTLGSIFCLLVLAIQSSAAEEVCYEPLGCFHNEPPFHSVKRPIAYLPWSPQDIGTTFWLYTRFNQFTYQLLCYEDETCIQNSNFSPFRKTKFIIHGYNSRGDNSWAMRLKNAILNAESVNVIVVDWRNGASAAYGQAATNTRVVGAQIEYLIRTLKDLTGALPRDFHLMGHSLGAHTAGYAGDRMSNLGRITGLDPAEPYFQGTLPVVRLDPSDANYVDAIHTDGDPFILLGWGMIEPVGHADFYPNGGYDQPGCPGNEVDNGGWWMLSCSHSRVNDLLIDSILNSDKPMYSYRCSSYKEYLAGSCNSCDSGGCPPLGYYSNTVATSDENNVKFYLTTRSESPYSVV